MHPKPQESPRKWPTMAVRRLPVAILIAGLILAAVGTGYAATASGDIPASFGVPARQHGDHGTYATQPVEGSPDRYVKERAFLVSADVPFHGPDGLVDRGDRIHEERAEHVEGDTWRFWQDVYDGERGSLNRGLWATDYWSGFHSRSFLIGVNALATPPAHELRKVHDLYDRDYEMCGLRNDLQGTHPSTDAPVRFHGQCGTTHLVAWASSQIDGHAVVAYVDPDDPQRIQVWMQEGIPYPVVIVERTDDGVLHTRLSTYADGDGDGEPTDLAPLPRVAVQPAADVPEPADGLVPYSLTDALEDAATHDEGEDIAAFLSDPAAYILAASYDEVQDQEVLRYRWSITLSDGARALAFAIVQDRASDDATVPLGIDLQDPDPTGAGHLSIEDAPAGPFPLRQDLPEALPPVADVAAAFSTWSGREPNAYAFEFHCRNDCSDVEGRVAAGHWRFIEEQGRQGLVVGGGLMPGDPSATGHRLWYNETGSIVRGDMLHQRQGPPGDIQGDPTDPQGVPLAPQASSVAAWQVPARVAAGTGAFAVLVGALYMFWPSLKQGLGATLFSRISGPALLQHPVRAAIHQAVEADPGIGIQAVAQRIDVSLTTARHHIAKLVASELLLRVDMNERSGLYVKGAISANAARALAMAKSPGAGKTLRCLVAAGASPVGAIAARQGTSAGTTSYHLKRLVAAGLATRERRGRQVIYTASPDAAAALGAAT